MLRNKLKVSEKKINTNVSLWSKSLNSPWVAELHAEAEVNNTWTGIIQQGGMSTISRKSICRIRSKMAKITIICSNKAQL